MLLCKGDLVNYMGMLCLVTDEVDRHTRGQVVTLRFFDGYIMYGVARQCALYGGCVSIVSSGSAP